MRTGKATEKEEEIIREAKKLYCKIKDYINDNNVNISPIDFHKGIVSPIDIIVKTLYDPNYPTGNGSALVIDLDSFYDHLWKLYKKVD